MKVQRTWKKNVPTAYSKLITKDIGRKEGIHIKTDLFARSVKVGKAIKAGASP